MIKRSMWYSLFLVIGWAIQAEGLAELCGDEREVHALRAEPFNATTIPANCFLIPEHLREAQFALWNTVADRRHLQVKNGLLALKSTAEIQAIAESDAARKAKLAEIENELSVNTICNTLDFAEMEARIDGATKPEDIKMILKKAVRCLIAFRKSQL